MTADLIAFLRARYDEAQKREQGKLRSEPSPFDGHDVEVQYDAGETTPDRFVLAELAAKRRVIDEYENAVLTLACAEPGTPPHDIMTGAVNTLERMLRYAVLPYDDRPDYRQEWMP